MTFSWGHGLYRGIEEDFRGRLPSYHKSRREGLSLLSALMLGVRSTNLMELASALPCNITHMDERYRYVERLLSNAHINMWTRYPAPMQSLFLRNPASMTRPSS
ncbi:MAG: hypothetical protein ACPGRX_08315 [Bdellovibrionales bacterium]